jgi:integrase
MTTGTKVKQEAEDFLRKQMTAVRDNRQTPLTDVKKIKYADLRAGLLASYTERGNKSLLTRADGDESVMGLSQLDSFFRYSDTNRGPSVLDIGTDTARAFVKQRQKEGVGNAVINRSLSCLRRMLRIAHDEGKISVCPKINLLKEPKPRKGFVNDDQFECLLKMLPTHLRAYITFLYHCGGRSGEAKQIEWSQVDLDRRLIRLEDEQTKNSEARTVPLPSVLVMMLREIEPKKGLVFDTTNLRKEWAKACAACGQGRMIPVEGKKYDPRYEGLTLHDLRRSAARNLLQVGVPETVIMKIGGWKTRSVFDRYAVASTADLTAAMQRRETILKLADETGKTDEMGKDKVNSVPVLTGEIANHQ